MGYNPLTIMSRYRFKPILLIAAGGAVLLCLALGSVLYWYYDAIERSATEIFVEASSGTVYAAVNSSDAPRVVDAALCRAPAALSGDRQPARQESPCAPSDLEAAWRSGGVLKLPNGTRARIEVTRCVVGGRVTGCLAGSGAEARSRGEEKVYRVSLASGPGKGAKVWVSGENVRRTLPPL